METITTGDSFQLNCGLLQVEILTPWSTRYSRTRFNHSAFMSNVSMAGICFTQIERDQLSSKSSGGMGLCSEYKCPEIEQSSLIGSMWLKPGVGVLQRQTQKWTHLDERKTAGLPTTVKKSKDTAVFKVISPIIGGYGYKEIRTIQIRKNIIRLEIFLENTGSEILTLLDYCHNFISLSNNLICPKHHLWLPCVKNHEEIIASDTLIGEAGGATWTKTPRIPFFQIINNTNKSLPSWELRHEEMSLVVGESVDFEPHHLALWGLDYCVSAEVYHEIFVKPGEIDMWSREWYFRI